MRLLSRYNQCLVVIQTFIFGFNVCWFLQLGFVVPYWHWYAWLSLILSALFGPIYGLFVIALDWGSDPKTVQRFNEYK